MKVSKILYVVSLVLFILALVVKFDVSLVTLGLGFLAAGHVFE